MKDVSDKLYSVLYSSLNGNVTYGGEQIPVYSVLPQSAQNDYIYLADYNLTADETKSEFMQNGYINIQVVTRYDHDGFSNKKVDNIAAQVKNLLKPTISSALDLSPDFNCTFFYLENDFPDYSLEQVENVSRRVLRYRIEVEEV